VEAGTDRMEHDPRRRALVSALYRVLGFVKDPVSTASLERKLLTSEVRTVHEEYMPAWHTGIGFGFGNDEGFGAWPWLAGREQWLAFFIEAHATAPYGVRRWELRGVWKGCDDPAAMQFFESERRTASDPRESLLIEAYLHQHDLEVDDDRIASAVKALARDRRTPD